MQLPPLINQAETCKRLGVNTRHAMYQWTKKGTFPPILDFSKFNRGWLEVELNEYITLKMGSATADELKNWTQNCIERRINYV